MRKIEEFLAKSAIFSFNSYKKITTMLPRYEQWFLAARVMNINIS